MQLAGVLLAIVAPVLLQEIFRHLPKPEDTQAGEDQKPFVIVSTAFQPPRGYTHFDAA